MPPRKKKKTTSKGQSRGASRGHLSGKPTRKKPITANRRKGFAGGKRPYDYAAYEKEPATPEYMERLFREYDFPVDGKSLEQFWQYYCLLRDRNAELDLTRIMGIEATVLKHFVDSMMIDRLVELSGPVLDIGTGPGFPGGPMAICKPERTIILGESRGKRVRFLEEVIQTLGLRNATVFSRSVREDSPFVPDTGEPASVDAIPVRCVISRALEVIPATLQRVQSFVPPGGKIAFMKGPNCGQEVTDGQQQFKGVYKMCDDIRYDLPNTNQHRRLVVFQRR